MAYPGDPTYQSDSRPLYDRVFKNSAKSPESRLWEAVILVFLFDCQKSYDHWVSSFNGNSQRLLDDLIELQYVSKTRHVEEICGLIDLDHSCFVDKVRKVCTGEDKLTHRSIHF